MRSSSLLLCICVFSVVVCGLSVAPHAAPAALAPTPADSTSFLQTMEKSDMFSSQLKAKLDSSWSRLPASQQKQVDEFGLPLEEAAATPAAALPAFALLETASASKAQAESGAQVEDYQTWLPTDLRKLLNDVDSSHLVSQAAAKVDVETLAAQQEEEANDLLSEEETPVFLEMNTNVDRASAAARAQMTAKSLSQLHLSTSLKAQVMALVAARAEAKAASAARVAHYEKFFAALHAANSDAADAKADATRDGDAADRNNALKQAEDMDKKDGSADNDDPDFMQHHLSPPWGTGSEAEWRKIHSYNDAQLAAGADIKSRGPLDVYVVNPDKFGDLPSNGVGPAHPPTPPGQSAKVVQAAVVGLGITRPVPRPQYGEQVGSRATASLYEQPLLNPAAKRLRSKLKPVAVQDILPLKAKLVDEGTLPTKPAPTAAEAEDELLRLQREYGI